MTMDHIVKSYDNDLNQLHHMIRDMGSQVVTQVKKASSAVMNKDPVVAQAVIDGDPAIDELEAKIDAFALRIIALRQPVAQDLRDVIGALKIASHLERVSDYAVNVAKKSLALQNMTFSPILDTIPRMGEFTVKSLEKTMEAYRTLNDQQAQDVWKGDARLDDMYSSLLRELLTHMMEDPRQISACTQWLFIAKHIERMGDHITNIAEVIHFLIHGHPFEETRPHGEYTQLNIKPPS